MSTNGEKQFEAAPFQVQLELFDGPIDLLLHLVKKNELAIERIALAKVATQYMECVERMRSMNLDMVAEYLVIAATLLSVKSSVLLNEPVELVVDEEGNLVDPHKVLLERLREAQVYREGASSLAQRKLLGQDVFSGPSHLKRVPAPPTQYKQHDPLLLGEAFRRVLKRVGQEDLRISIDLESISIVETMMSVLERLQGAGGSAPFESLIPDVTSRMSLIATFIALLELCKRGAIGVDQEDASSDILISLSKRDLDSQVTEEELSSEFDEAAADA